MSARHRGQARAAPAAARSYRRTPGRCGAACLLTREAAVIAVLVIVFVYSRLNVEFFDSPLTLYYLFLDMAPILLIALPMTLVIITGEIDLSVASVVGLSSVTRRHPGAGPRLSVPTGSAWSRSWSAWSAARSTAS